MGIEFFLVTILAKGSILDVWHGSEYGNEYCCKIFAGLLLMSIGKHQNKGVHVEKGYDSSEYLCLHFIQFFIFIFKVWFVIFHLSHYSFCRCLLLPGTHADCVLLASALNKIIVLLQMLSQYLATAIIRGVFRTQSNIYDGAFSKTG